MHNDTYIRHTNMKVTDMKPQLNVLGSISAVQQSKWKWPTFMTLVLLVAVLGVTGCQPHH